MELRTNDGFDTCIVQERRGHFGLQWIVGAKDLFERGGGIDTGGLTVWRRPFGKGRSAVGASREAGTVLGKAAGTVHGVWQRSLTSGISGERSESAACRG